MCVAIGVFEQPIPITLEDTRRNIFRIWGEDWPCFGQIKWMGNEYKKRSRKGNKDSKGILQRKTEILSSSSFKGHALRYEVASR